MKVFVSYVIQDQMGHKHASETITVPGYNPPFNKCESPPLKSVQQWIDEKKLHLQKDQEIVLLSMCKVS